MQPIMSLDALMQTLSAARLKPARRMDSVRTGLPAIDALLPDGKFALGAVHEVLSESPCLLLPLLLARSAMKFGKIVWCDPLRRFYPPAAARMGLPLDRLLIVRPAGGADLLWALHESLRCGGVGACVAPAARLTPLQVRRLQLAAERGGGVGLLMRPIQAISWPYAAASRWLLEPLPAAPAALAVRRWRATLIRAHGGQEGRSVVLEVERDNHHVRAIDPLADRPAAPQAAPASA